MTWALLAIATVFTVAFGLALPATDVGTWAFIAFICFTGAMLADTGAYYRRTYVFRRRHRWPAPKSRRDMEIANSQS